MKVWEFTTHGMHIRVVLMPIAAQSLIALMKKSKQLGFSGDNLKDEHQLSDIDLEGTQKLLF